MKAIESTIPIMNHPADKHISDAGNFTNQFVFPAGLAIGVLKQAAYDLRRYRAATKAADREVYLDAHSWITAYDSSWPYSFMNVCKLLDLCPEMVRADLLADASLGPFHYWIRRAGRLSRKLSASVVRVFESRQNPESVESNQ